MALFSKLKERLLKSSSRLGKEVDAIVEEGAVTPDPVPETTPHPAPVQEKQPPAETAPAPADAAPPRHRRQGRLPLHLTPLFRPPLHRRRRHPDRAYWVGSWGVAKRPSRVGCWMTICWKALRRC